MQRPDLCKKCKEPCCTRPALTTDEYIALYSAVGAEKIMAYEPEWVNDSWMFAKGCPGLTSTGCVLSYEDRPLMCRLFPWVIAPILGDTHREAHHDLLLTMRCPQWKAFGENYEFALKEFENG